MIMKLLKRLSIFTILCIFIMTASSSAQIPVVDDYQASLGRVYTLDTTFDSERYARFTADGNTIHARGYFKDCVVTGFFISSQNLRNIRSEFAINSDGSFSASFSGTPSEKNAYAVISFEDGNAMAYRVEYTPGTGWFFGDNGLSARTAAALEHYFTASLTVSENYVSGSLDPREIKETRENLLEIVSQVTAGIDGDYQKARALSIWVADNIVYDRDARDNEVDEETISVSNTLKRGRSVCIGIANTYGALLEAAGLKVLNIKGGVISPAEGVPYELLADKTLIHEWVAFWYEDESRWVYADPTWDMRGFYQYGEYNYKPSIIKHFDISPLALSFDHRGDRAELRQYFGQQEAVNEPHVSTSITTTVPSAPTQTTTTSPSVPTQTTTNPPTEPAQAETSPPPVSEQEENPPPTDSSTVTETEPVTEITTSANPSDKIPSETTEPQEPTIVPVISSDKNESGFVVYLVVGAVLLLAAVLSFFVVKFKIKK
ncbi:MAG: transglutaminase-like domain-containing protein [Oscillospiraceae bacterium]|nr:transglutaminase-like domain-containing protein [Oscillospiraceae bacterium]